MKSISKKNISKKILAVVGAAAILVTSQPQSVVAQEAGTSLETQTQQSTTQEAAAEETLSIEETSTMVKKQTSTTNISNFGYWVYRPTESTEEALPLIIYLHGISERGSNLDKLTTVSLPMYLYQKDVSVNAVVIAPQCPAGTNWDSRSEDVMELIRTVIEEENIDESRISLTGHSLGGIGTWKIALKNPGFFSCLVPVSSSINTPKACSALTDTPVWTFHGSKDTAMGFSILDAQKVIEAAGGSMQVTMLEGQGHCITGIVYNNAEYDILNWMASQQRTEEIEEVEE